MKRKSPQHQSEQLPPHSTFPWLNPSSSSSQRMSSVIPNNHHHNRPTTCAVDQIKHMNDLSEEDCLHFEAPKFVDTASILRDHEEKQNELGGKEKSNQHHPQHQHVHHFHSLPNPPGFSQHHHKIIISNSIHRRLYIVVLIVLVFLIAELTVLRHKIGHNSVMAKNAHQHTTDSKNELHPLHFFTRIDATAELMSVFWSALVCITLCSMVQTFEISLDTMTGDITWSRYRSLYKASAKRFTMTGVRQVVATIQDQSSTMKKKGGVADTSRVQYSIELVVLSEAIKNRDQHHHSSNDMTHFQVDSILGNQNASENLKLWAGFFLRMGVHCEIGKGDLVSSSGTERV